MASTVDELDRKILRELMKDSTLSTRALGGILGESSSTLYNRIRRLIDRGVIQSYTVILDPEMIGMEVTAYCMISVEESAENTIRQIAENVAKIKGVKSVSTLLGSDYEIICLLRTHNVKELGGVVLEQIRLVNGVVDTKVSLVHEQVLKEVEKAEEIIEDEVEESEG